VRISSESFSSVLTNRSGDTHLQLDAATDFAGGNIQPKHFVLYLKRSMESVHVHRRRCLVPQGISNVNERDQGVLVHASLQELTAASLSANPSVGYEQLV
jgi:hypothetical protein